VEVALVDDIVIDDGDVLDAASSQQSEHRRAKSARTDDENALSGAPH
jgi:hypothetical protein